MSNTIIGHKAGTQISSGYNNIAIGVQANRWGNGNDTIAIGYGSFLNADLSGDKNIGIGYLAGNNITSGSGNVVIGNADVPSATGDNQLSISSNSSSSVTWITGNSSGNVSLNQLADVITVSSNTTLTQAQSGSYVYWTSGTLTLPDGCAAGTQFTIFNNTGSSATVGLNTNGVINIGWASNAAVADNDATSYVCTSEAAGASYWVQVGA
jgi:hypothetical protein